MKKLTRRDLLLGAAVSPLIPTLESFAASASPPRRLLLVFSAGGMVPERFWPTKVDFPSGAPDTKTTQVDFPAGRPAA
jgi:hypothetical protein